MAVRVSTVALPWWGCTTTLGSCKSAGEGLGNAFLSHIRETDAIAMVLRCFEDEDVAHVEGAPDPQRDCEIVEIELALADLATMRKRIAKLERDVRAQSNLRPYLEAALRLSAALEDAGAAVGMGYWSGDDLPFYYGLASTFPLADRWFSSCLGPTFPNRRFLIAGTAHGLIDDAPYDLLDYPPAGTIWQCCVCRPPRPGQADIHFKLSYGLGVLQL